MYGVTGTSRMRDASTNKSGWIVRNVQRWKKKDGEERDIKYCCALELEANYLLYFWIAQFVKFLYTQENL